jgi:hypothetical protein
MEGDTSKQLDMCAGKDEFLVRSHTTTVSLTLHSPQIKTVFLFCVSLGVTKLNPVALARKRTIPTERPPLVGEVGANFCG